MLPIGAYAVEKWSVHGSLLDEVRRMLYELDPVDGPHALAIPEILPAPVPSAST